MKKLSFIAALGFGTAFTASAWADCISGDCASLGYSTADVPDCENYIYCPFDINYKICAHVAPKLLDSCPAGKTCVEKYRVSGDEAACSTGYKKTVTECGTLSNGYYTLGIAQSTNDSCKQCVKNCNSGYTLSGTVCSKNKTCNDIISELGCERYNDGAKLPADVTSNICLMGSVSASSTGFSGDVTVYDMSWFDECKSEMNGRTGSLNGNVLYIKDHVHFCTNVNIVIMQVLGEPGFYGDSTITANVRGGNTWFNFYEGADCSAGRKVHTENNIAFNCTLAALNRQCDITINKDKADVYWSGDHTSITCLDDEFGTDCYER